MNQIPARALRSPVAIHCTVMATSWIESYKAAGSYKTMLQKRNTALAAQTSQEGRSWRHLLFFYLFAFFFHFSHLFFCLHCTTSTVFHFLNAKHQDSLEWQNEQGSMACSGCLVGQRARLREMWSHRQIAQKHCIVIFGQWGFALWFYGLGEWVKEIWAAI